MKQKIVIKVQMNCDKCRTKGMKIAATTYGVSSVAIQGSDKDQLVVSGQGVDSVKLTCSLRKKLCYANILSVEEVKENADTPEKKEETPGDKCSASFPACYQYQPSVPACFQYQPFPNYHELVVYDPYPNICSIM